ncbi:MAG: 1-acyl-sn-glycerol-3-phosphate acyltransferase [Porticoccaceae bacterium]|nr:1-acyl-sn-glycerol-3-phosphate acyltransferase [Porticoccaceae bacterium]
MNEFDDIRPYNDAEVPAVIARLIADPEFIDLLLSRKVPLLAKLCPWFLRPFVRLGLRKLTRDMRTVNDLQVHMSEALAKVLDATTDGYSFGGLDNLDPCKAALYISNHRDIALDPALVCQGLFAAGKDSVRIAIGDNLLSKSFAADLMRVNRSFIVKRSATARREKLEALKQLSRYIRHSISQEKVSIWIAQAEGRAKNGRDRTETALLKMLALSKGEGQDFATATGELNLIPVSISYEYDPCDADKARELYSAQQGTAYVKKEFEDLDTIQKGILGYKGRVHVNFGQPVGEGFENADALAAEVDRQIFSHYQLFPTNIIAWQMQGNSEGIEVLQQQWPGEDWLKAQTSFQSHIDQIPADHRQIVIDAYAAPVDNQIAYQSK